MIVPSFAAMRGTFAAPGAVVAADGYLAFPGVAYLRAAGFSSLSRRRSQATRSRSPATQARPTQCPGFTSSIGGPALEPRPSPRSPSR
jgi:protein involved in polysaccharide export with SLBB domain